jgi:hypothetical protein
MSKRYLVIGWALFNLVNNSLKKRYKYQFQWPGLFKVPEI